MAKRVRPPSKADWINEGVGQYGDRDKYTEEYWNCADIAITIGERLLAVHSRTYIHVVGAVLTSQWLDSDAVNNLLAGQKKNYVYYMCPVGVLQASELTSPRVSPKKQTKTRSSVRSSHSFHLFARIDYTDPQPLW